MEPAASPAVEKMPITQDFYMKYQGYSAIYRTKPCLVVFTKLMPKHQHHTKKEQQQIQKNKAKKRQPSRT